MPIDRNDNMTGGTAAVFDGNVNIVAMPYSKERFIQECAMTLFANTLFNDGVNKLYYEKKVHDNFDILNNVIVI